MKLQRGPTGQFAPRMRASVRHIGRVNLTSVSGLAAHHVFGTSVARLTDQQMLGVENLITER